jgi:hypothetical protein
MMEDAMPKGIKKEDHAGWLGMVLFSFISACILAATAGCGGNGSDGGGSGNHNSVLDGSYYMIHMQESIGLSNQSNAMTFDGRGGYNGNIVYDSGGDTGSYSGTYTVSTDDELTFTGTDMVGTVSADGNTFSVVDTSPAGVDNSIAMGISIKTSSGITTSDVAGDFIVSQIRDDGTRPETSLFVLTLDGSGAFTGSYIADSDGSSGSLSGTYTVAGDGGFGLAITGLTKTFQGHASSNGGLFIILDIDNDGEVLLMVGLKKTTGADASIFSGDYQMHVIGGDNSGNWTSRYNAASNGAGGLTASIVSDSGGDTGQYNLSYTVAADGSLSITETGEIGIVSADGEMFIMVDADDSDNDVLMAFGMLK